MRFIYFALLVFTFVACDKYEEGSNFTLLSAKNRITNTWELVASESIVNGVSGPTGWTQCDFIVSDNNTYTWNGTLNGSPASEIAGTWQFNSDKNKFITNEDGVTMELDIVKLKKKELKLRYTENNYIVIYEFEAD